VRVDAAAVERLAAGWTDERFTLPTWDYPGLPTERANAVWFDYCGIAASVMACLWPAEGQARWQVELEGAWLADAQALFACFTRGLRAGPEGLDLEPLVAWSDLEAEEFFGGRGQLQLIPQRRERLSLVARALRQRWAGRFVHLAEEAQFDAPTVVELLVETLPGYRDEAETELGRARFNKLAHLAAAMMAHGSDLPFTGTETFPVYPDYMLPKVLRYHGVLVYEAGLARAVDTRQLIPPADRWEVAIRWATVSAAEQLRSALERRGNAVQTPALDYHLWHAGVLGPDAPGMGEHHRTLTLAY
jgi:hypothetical protein